MKRYEMIKKHEEFSNIINNGTKLKGKYLLIFYQNKNYIKPNFGLAISKKVGNAVLRNKLKRRLRNIIDNNRLLFKNNQNYIIMIKKEATLASYKELENDLINLLRKDNNEK